MFLKAKRFEPPGLARSNVPKKNEETQKAKIKVPLETVAAKVKPVKPLSTPMKVKTNLDAQSQCSSSLKSVKSFVTPRPAKTTVKPPSSLKKPSAPPNVNTKKTTHTANNDLIKAQEVEIRNKDYTIAEYHKQIEDLKNEIANMHKQLKESISPYEVDTLNKQLSDMNLNEKNATEQNKITIENLKNKISILEQYCEKLEEEVSSKQVDLTSLEEIINIRDSLCQDLQEKLTSMEASMEETKQRLEMVKGHHALALEANESIRREYKAELEALRSKFEDEKLIIVTKSKADQELLKSNYNKLIDTVKCQLNKDRDCQVKELKQQLIIKDEEIEAKLEQINEATQEKLKLCEIQFEERTRSIQEHLSEQTHQIQYLENETTDLKIKLKSDEELKLKLHKELNVYKNEANSLRAEKLELIKETECLKEESRKKLIEFDNKINKLTADVEKATNEKNKFEMSLSVTRDIVQVLTMRLRESDNELDHLENTVLSLNNSKEVLENELSTFKNKLNTTIQECNEYKEALVNILKSKAALAKEHTRIMEHNVSLIESLQHVEKEAYRELGSIKNELIEDVEFLKKESDSQIKVLREEVENKRMLCELATEHAGQASAAAEQSRVLLAQAAAEIARLENDNQRLQQQIQDQQSLVVELSLLRQENEELSMAVAKQSSVVEKMKKDAEQVQTKPKSPSVIRKSYKSGKENMQVVVSPLRERNH